MLSGYIKKRLFKKKIFALCCMNGIRLDSPPIAYLSACISGMWACCCGSGHAHWLHAGPPCHQWANSLSLTTLLCELIRVCTAYNFPKLWSQRCGNDCTLLEERQTLSGISMTLNCCRHAEMMAVYNQHLLQSGTPVLRFKKPRWQHTPMADTPRSNVSSTYDLEDSFLAQGKPKRMVGHANLMMFWAQRVRAHPSICMIHASLVLFKLLCSSICS